MTTELLIKGFVALIFSVVFAFLVADQDPSGETDTSRQKYRPYISGGVLPVCVLTLGVMALIFLDAETAAEMTAAFCFGVFLHICLYYLLLMPLLPLLRRHISARSCAMLWMIPNYLYVTMMNYMRLPGPRWVIQPPTRLVWALLALWLAGFVGVLGWKIVSHLAFRSRILKDAVPIADPAVLEVWQKEVELGRFRKPKFRLVASPAVQTPLSVGLFQRSVRVVLPERSYSPEELSLIFRHELIHIGREDAWNKFFLVFCTAMCWFAPVMWTAMRKSAEDLELSCDETVLLDAGEDTKRRYAGLLLKTAGDERGFTTCLSASANALRYRLKSVVEPKRKRSGALIVGLTFFLLCMSCGYVTIAYGDETGAELIYQSQGTEEWSLHHARWTNTSYDSNLISIDEAGLHRYLSTLPMKLIGGNYTFSQEGKSLFLMLDGPEGTLSVIVSDQYIKLVPLYGKARAEYYYLPGGVDWDRLGACVLDAPSLRVWLTGTEGVDVETGLDPRVEIGASLWRASLDGEVLYEMDARDHPNGIYGYPSNRAELSFGLPLLGECAVEIAPMKKGGNVQRLTLDETSLAFDLPEEPVRCTVRCAVQGVDGKTYQAEFRFVIDGIE